MHPHGVKYNPEYDGTYMGEYTRAGGSIASRVTGFTYQWRSAAQLSTSRGTIAHGPDRR